MGLLKATGPARSVGVVAEGRAPGPNRVPEKLWHEPRQALEARAPDPTRPARRPNAGPMEKLVSVDVAEARDQALIEQGRLDRSARGLEPARQRIGRDRQGIASETPPPLVPQAIPVGERPDAAEAAHVPEYQPRAARDPPGEMGVVRRPFDVLEEPEETGHPQMQAQAAAAFRNEGELLPVARELDHPIPFQEGFGRGGPADDRPPSDPHLGEPGARQGAAEAASNALDLGQLRHGADSICGARAGAKLPIGENRLSERSTRMSEEADRGERDLEHAAGEVELVRREIRKAVVGQNEVIDELLIALLCRGHALLEGVPGLAKTLLVSSLARSLGLAFNRIQFTPDLMPSDITGTEVLDVDQASGHRSLRFVRGPIFTQVLLADEVNRTPPKTQSALLEGMQEQQVTAGGTAHGLPQPFFVLATQNPIEQEGTYPLPEAQLDRFMLMIRIRYPGPDNELEIMRRTTGRSSPGVDAVLSPQRVQALQELVRDVPVPEHAMAYALRLVRATRSPENGEPDDRPGDVGPYLAWGAGPRASQNLVLAAKARAVLERRSHANVDDVAAVAEPVLRHRLIPNFNAEADGIDADELIRRLLRTVPVTGEASEPILR